MLYHLFSISSVTHSAFFASELTADGMGDELLLMRRLEGYLHCKELFTLLTTARGEEHGTVG